MGNPQIGMLCFVHSSPPFPKPVLGIMRDIKRDPQCCGHPTSSLTSSTQRCPPQGHGVGDTSSLMLYKGTSVQQSMA